MQWDDFPANVFANAELNFNPQAFFNDYMFSGESEQADKQHQWPIGSYKAELANGNEYSLEASHLPTPG